MTGDKNIVLVGMRGSGKTTTAKHLARQLGKEFIEIDARIITRAGMSVPEIVKVHGWDYFRDLESEIVREAAARANIIVSTGGGAVLRQENVDALKQNGICFYLYASPEALIRRAGSDANRPRLTDKPTMKEEIEHLLPERVPLYEAAADYTIETNGKTPAQVAAEILSKLEPIG